MNLLIVGGAGYIGSHTCQIAKQRGHNIIVLDDFSNCTYSNIKKLGVDRVISGRAGSTSLPSIDAVIYLAASKSVTEGEQDPMKYVYNNIYELDRFINIIKPLDIPFVFASSAAVYGEPSGLITPDSLVQPTSVYGMTKAIGEKLVRKLNRAVILRYFNVAGAGDGIGEEYGRMGNFIPRIFQQKDLVLRGGNLDTEDGFPERDYIHVLDVARINVESLENQVGVKTHNVSSGIGTSVLGLLQLSRRDDYKTQPLEGGEVSRLVARRDLELEFTVEDIIESSRIWYGPVSVF